MVRALKNLRSDFPIFAHQDAQYTYLDTAATAHKPQVVIDALSRFYSESYGTVHRAVYHLATQASAKYHAARVSVQKFLKASVPEEIIFTKGTTESLNLLAYSLGERYLKEGDSVLITEMEHHSNIVPWQEVCKRKRVNLLVAPINKDGDLCIESLKKLLEQRPKIFAFSHISNTLGTVNPAKDLCQMAKEHSILTVVDGAQSAPHLPIDVQEIGCDFFVFSGHKLYGPTGIGVLYGKKSLLENLPPYQTGGSMVETVSFEKTSFSPPPLRFEAGTPVIGEAIGLAAAIDYLNSFSWQERIEQEFDLLEYITEALSNFPRIEVLGSPKERSSVLSFVVEGAHPLDVATFLNLKNVALRSGHHCAQPCLRKFGHEHTLRLSLGIYTEKRDLHHFLLQLEQVLALL